MKGVSHITNSSNRKIAVQIDLKLLEQQGSLSNIEDFIDGIIAESKKHEPRKPLAQVVAQ